MSDTLIVLSNDLDLRVKQMHKSCSIYLKKKEIEVKAIFFLFFFFEKCRVSVGT